MPDRDVTELVRTGSVDDEFMSIGKCVCGEEFKPWNFSISIYRKDAHECPKCGRKLYFQQTVRVFEVVDTPLKSGSALAEQPLSFIGGVNL